MKVRRPAILGQLADDLPSGRWTMRRTKQGGYVLYIGDKRVGVAYTEELARYILAVAPERLLESNDE